MIDMVHPLRKLREGSFEGRAGVGVRAWRVSQLIAFLCSSPSLADQTPTQIHDVVPVAAQLPENLSLLTGKRVLVGQIALCVGNTLKVRPDYRGRPAKVLGFRPTSMKMQTEGLSPAVRSAIENIRKGGILYLQFDDGTKLNTCAPESAKQLSQRLRLAPGEMITASDVGAHADLPPIIYTARMSQSHPAAPVFSSDDFPDYLDRADVRRSMFIRVDVLRNGAPIDCQVEISSGDKALDQYTCGLIIKRAHFSSATWPDGSVVYGVIRSWLSWVNNFSGPAGSNDGDLDVTVNQLPKDIRSPHTEVLLLAVDETGHIVACEADTAGLSKSEKSIPQLAQLACDQLKKSFSPRPPLVEGHQKKSVQTATVRFSTQRQ